MRCGAGTLLLEGGSLQPHARFRGFDLDPDAIRAARANAAIDRVLCNPPWGTQVGAAGLLERRPSRWWSELRRVLAPGGSAVVLIPDTGDLTLAIRHGLIPVHVQQVRLSGLQPSIVRLAPPPQRSRPSSQRRRPAAGRGPGPFREATSCIDVSHPL
ncbi:hypothetical protein [Spirillospora sp. NPDC047279]|uniref:hypothetical protein n=1 Tax=Spirillospora sp. NPDC047279 TaxID=3155478 RepID=UPI0033E8D53D